MPVDEDPLETAAGTITEFLRRNRVNAFPERVIADATELSRHAVASALSRLEAAGIVEQDGADWTLSDAYRASDSALSQTSLTAGRYDDGTEFDVTAWAATAEDPAAREYRETE